MGVNLLQLPDECICTILSFLRPSQIQRVALTFNRRLFTMSHLLLAPLAKIRNDEKYFESLFGKFDVEPHENPTKKTFERLGLANYTFSEPIRSSRHLEYLNLKGDLSWFENILAQDKGPSWDFEGPLNDGQKQNIRDLIETARKLGLVLPHAFTKFLLSDELLTKFMKCWSWVPETPLLTKVRGQVEGEKIEGYVFEWFSEPSGCGYMLMYLDKAGRHAIFNCASASVTSVEYDEDEDDADEKARYAELGFEDGFVTDDDGDSTVEEERSVPLTQQEKDLGVCRGPPGYLEKDGDLRLEDIDFEHWLVNKYYAMRIYALIQEEQKDIPEHVNRYLYNVYTAEGRAMQ